MSHRKRHLLPQQAEVITDSFKKKRVIVLAAELTEGTLNN